MTLDNISSKVKKKKKQLVWAIAGLGSLALVDLLV